MDQSAKRALLEQAVRLLGRMKVAKRLGVPEPVLGAWMRGETPMPSINLLILATMLDEQAKAKDGAVRPRDERKAR